MNWRLLLAALPLLVAADRAAAEVASGASWLPATVSMPVRQVGRHSYYVQGRLEEATRANQGFNSNAGFVITNAGVVVFDALGSPALADRLIAEIRRRTAQPIRLVVISHYHADHFYGIAALRAAGAQIWADGRARAYLNSDAARRRIEERRRDIGPWLGADFRLPLPDRWIEAGEQFSVGGVRFGLVRLGPAHSPEDLALWVEPDAVLYSGDVVYAGRVPYVGEDSDTRHWLVAIDRVLALEPRVLVPGHGPATRVPRRDAQLTRQYLEFLRTQMAAAVRDFRPFDEAYAAVDWRRFSAAPTFNVANRGNAYAVYLQMEQEALAR